MANSGERLLVTGGCGYVGSRLVPALLDRDKQVRVLDCHIFGNRLPASALRSPGLAVIKADIRNREAVAAALEGVDAVIHLAALANDPSAEMDPELTRQVNLEAVFDLVRAARRAGVRRFINASTATVYGVREEPDVDETFEHRPITLYGKYKSETDVFVAAENSAAFVTTSLRSATVCGWSPRMRLDLTVNILAEQAKRCGELTVHGGSQRRPNIVIDDLVRAYLAVLDAPAEKVAGRSFNVGASNHSVLDIAHIVARAVNPGSKINIAPIHDHRSYHISTRKIADVLGFRPQYDIDGGARQVAAAMDDGRLSEPGAAIYRNLAQMKAVGFA